MDEYYRLLNFFNTKIPENDLIQTLDSLVQIDDIHDAIEKVGIDFIEPLGFYITAARNIAKNRNKYYKNRKRIIEENAFIIIDERKYEIDFDNIYQYEFNEKEVIIINELLNDIKPSKSQIKRKKYNFYKDRIKSKLCI